MRHLDFNGFGYFEEILNGDHLRLARLTMMYLDNLVEEQLSWDICSPCFCLTSLLHLFLTPPLQNQFFETLCSHGFVPTFVRALDYVVEVSLLRASANAAGSSSSPNTFETTSACEGSLLFLIRMLTVSPGYRQLADTIQAGLLRTLATQIGPVLDYDLGYISTNTLPDNVLDHPELKASKKSDDWESFTCHAKERIDAARLRIGIGSSAACGVIPPITATDSVKRRIGSAAGIAISVSSPNKTTEFRSCTLDFLERQFMRNMVLLMAKSGEPLFVYFDYMYDPVDISVHSVADSPTADALDAVGPEWADMVARARRSRGRMELHVMQVPDDDKTRFWVPCEIPVDSDEKAIESEIDRILDDTVDVLEMH
ncbi:hypothetical protein DFH08DRAFT_997814 [Mycena albidolilacea]|uniref:Uncharacterized protein n=1 Tax=Mycena albidolilacea TaxID=1033008 RepID=A0AAD6YXJ8_9AGAR|nr:hypothetical protein DFH08DRAFT_997814 [Mycena albidolilacea]